MSDPLATISDLLEPIFAGLNGGEPADPTVRPSDRADAQVNGALALAKQIGGNPRDIAEAVVESRRARRAVSELEIAGPGFINVTFSPDVPRRAAGERRGRRTARRVGRVTAPRPWSSTTRRPTSPRRCTSATCARTVIGDALVRMLEFLGHQ